MGTASKYCYFVADAEGLVDAGLTANITFAWTAADGSPWSGCTHFTSALVLAGITEKATGMSFTWEDLGVPAGNIVTAIRVKCNTRLYSDIGFTSRELTIRLNSGGTLITGSDPFFLGTGDGEASTWTSRSFAADQAVLASYQASSTTIDLEMELLLTTGYIGAIDYRIDSIVVEADYEAGATTTRSRYCPPARLYLTGSGPGTEYICHRTRTAPQAGGYGTIPMGKARSVSSVSGTPIRRSRTSPVSVAITAGTVVSSEPTVTGNVRHSQCRDGLGTTWTTDQAVGTGGDTQAAGMFFGDRFGVLYTRGGKVYFKSTMNASDWSGAAEVDTGIYGAVKGACALAAGTIAGLVYSATGWRVMVSKDLGATWSLSTTGPFANIGSTITDASMVAIADWMIVCYPVGGQMKHVVSGNSGATWA